MVPAELSLPQAPAVNSKVTSAKTPPIFMTTVIFFLGGVFLI